MATGWGELRHCPAGSDPLEDRRDALPATDAHGGERVPAAGPAQLIQRLDGEDRPGRADRVAEGHPAAVGVGPLGRQAQLTDDGERLGGEGLVHLEEVDLVELEAGPVEHLAGRGHGTHAHDPRLNPRAAANDPDAITTAAAASLMPEALPGVTVPSSANEGRSLARSSVVTPGRMCSSVSTVTVPFLLFTSTGVICSVKYPASLAAAARRWLSAASTSWSSREIP